MSIEENKAIYLGLSEAFDRGEVARWPAFLAPDFVSHEPGREDRDGDTTLRNWAAIRPAFSDLKMTAPQLAAEGDMLGCHFIYEGTVAATGEPAYREGWEIVRFAGGRIAESWALPAPMSQVSGKPLQPSKRAGNASIEESKAIYAGLTEAWDRGEAERWPDFLAPDFVSHEPGREDWDRAAWLRVGAAGYAYGSDWKSTLLQVVAEGDMLACHYAMEVTGNGRGVTPVGRRGRREGFEIVRFAGGRIAESWNLFAAGALLPEEPSPAAGG